ncbi:MAG TPA: AMP-binding protein, partial [Longimicrobiales bacterium]|nr:AMP-binding protein [Longimicrobiales bacterium]
MRKPDTLTDLLQAGEPTRTALSTPGGAPLSYHALRALVTRTGDALARRGIAPNDRVAIVLDNGPEMAATFLSVAACATAAPLNPSYRADEFEFYLTDLKAKLIIVAQGRESAANQVAQRLGIPLARLVAQPEQGAGSFVLEFDD